MPQMWFIRVGDQERGPISSQQLKLLAAKGKLKRSDFVRVAERSNWIPAERVSGLFESQAVSSQPQSDASPSSKGDQDIENRASWWLQMAVRIVQWIIINLARRPKVTLAVACLLAVISLFWFSTTGSVDPKLAQIGQPSSVDLSQLDVHSDVSQLQSELRGIVDQNKSFQAKERMRDRQALEQQARNVARREKEENEHRERVIKAEAELKEFREKEEQSNKARIETEERLAKALADRLFSGISFDPKQCVFMSKSLRESGATVEIVGRDYKALRERFDNRDWLKVCFPYPQRRYPSEWTFNKVLTGFYLLDRWGLQLLVRTSKNYDDSLFQDKPVLSAFEFPLSLDLSTIHESNLEQRIQAYQKGDAAVNTIRFSPISIELDKFITKHPDNIGYINEWDPLRLVILFVDPPDPNFKGGGRFCLEMQEKLNEKESQLRSKQSLGELEEEDIRREYTKEVVRQFQEARKWAENY